jgi:signal transduction histidine kinase
MSMQITPVSGEGGMIERSISIQTDVSEMRKTSLELEEAKRRAESAKETKTQVLATISYEMRTSLNAILGSTDLAREVDGDAAVRRSHLTTIHENAGILLRFISDMLDVSKIEAGQFDLQLVSVSLRTSLEAVLTPLGARAAAKGLAFDLSFDESLPYWVMADPDRLRQIVVNLIENAIKFTDQGSLKVEVSLLEAGPAGGAGFKIRVIDTGIGIAPEDQSRIFLRFERGEVSKTRSKGGAGLGLNIVKSLVEALGGKVSVKSSLGQGVESSVVLPLVVAPDAVPTRDLHPPLRNHGSEVAEGIPSRILVAEDTNANFALVEIFLQKAGHQVIRAVNGRDAVACAKDVDLILMDVEMPDMDGLEATRLIRRAESEEGRAAVPILALTAHSIQGYRERCLEAGCTGCFTKPVRRDGLIEMVRAAFSGRRSLPNPTGIRC